MAKIAVIRTGGKQYVVSEGQEIIVEKLEGEKAAKVTLETLAIFDIDKSTAELGSPLTTAKVNAQIVEQGKGDKIRVARFKSKVRYRKVRGFRPHLTKLKIEKI